MNTDEDEIRKPTIVLPYIESCKDDNRKDLFLYLRPETNGIAVESHLFGVIHSEEKFRENIELVYLSNLPGDFVSHHNVIERHYKLKCEMAKYGRICFTPLMIKRFEKWYDVSWDDVKVISSYQALKELNITSKELFELWVKDHDFFYIHGQSVKKIGDLYVINYDIPELLKKNSALTDIAVMVLRTKLSNRDLTSLISKMEQALKNGGVIDPETPPRRCFHYTKSPLEEILDAHGYLYNSNGDSVEFEKITFANYLMERGIPLQKIKKLIYYPIVRIEENGNEKEVYLYDYLMGDSYEDAYEKISKVTDN